MNSYSTSWWSLLLTYRPREDERLSWRTYSGRFTHINGYPSAAGQWKTSERSETDVLPLSHRTNRPVGHLTPSVCPKGRTMKEKRINVGYSVQTSLRPISLGYICLRVQRSADSHCWHLDMGVLVTLQLHYWLYCYQGQILSFCSNSF